VWGSRGRHRQCMAFICKLTSRLRWANFMFIELVDVLQLLEKSYVALLPTGIMTIQNPIPSFRLLHPSLLTAHDCEPFDCHEPQLFTMSTPMICAKAGSKMPLMITEQYKE
jgi:hypothetical protein